MQYVIDLLITSSAYLVAPFVIALLIKKPLSNKAINIIIVANCFIVWSIFGLFYLFILDDPQTANMVVAILWGAIGRQILIKRSNHILNNGSQKKHISIPKIKLPKYLWVVALIIVVTVVIVIIPKGKVDDAIAEDTGILGIWTYELRNEIASTYKFNHDGTFKYVVRDEVKKSGKYKYVREADEIVLFLDNGGQEIIGAIKEDNLLRIHYDYDDVTRYFTLSKGD